jgi:hypothetical protein
MNDTPAAESRLDVAVVLGLMFQISMGGAALVFLNIPKDNVTLFAALLMVVMNGFSLYLGYRWGASKSGATKDATIAAMVPKDGAP